MVLASGAKLDTGAEGDADDVPQTVAGEHGVFAKIDAGMTAGALAGHCVTAEVTTKPLYAAHPGHANLAALQARGLCAGFSLAENSKITLYEGTGAARQVAHVPGDRVKVSFAQVKDTGLQKNLDALSATCMPTFKATNMITAIQSQAMTQGGMNAAIVQKFSLADTGGFYRNLIAVGAGAAFTTSRRTASGGAVDIAPTAYIPTVRDDVFTRMLVNTPLSARETWLLGQLYRARRPLNPSMQDIEATMLLAGVTKPPMHLRGEHVVLPHTGEMSSVVVKNGCYPQDASWTWAREHAARAAVAVHHGMSSFRHLSSEVWIANFFTNPTPAVAAVAGG